MRSGLPSALAPIRVFLVSSFPILRAGLRRLLAVRHRFALVGEAAGLADMPRLAVAPDVFLIEPAGDNPSCLADLPALLAHYPRSRAVLLVRQSRKEWEAWGLRRGILGVVGAEEPPAMLVQAIRQVHAGQIWLSPATVADTLSQLATRGKSGRGKPLGFAVDSLTPREWEVVLLVGEALSNRQIAERLFISTITVRHHLTSIFGKLGIGSRLELAQYAFRHGLTEAAGISPESTQLSSPREAARRLGAS